MAALRPDGAEGAISAAAWLLGGEGILTEQEAEWLAEYLNLDPPP